MSGSRKPETPAAPLEALHSLIFDSIREGVFTVDKDFRVTSFNAEAERITGFSRREAVGRKCYEVFRASICQQGCALRETLESGRPLRDVRVDVLNAAMRSVPITVSTAVLRTGGRLLGGVEIFRDISDIESLRAELTGQGTFENIVGASPPMQELFRLLPDVAASDAPVLLLGPSGTGKELVASAIHRLSPRREQPFLRVNCGALPDTLLESELFGYQRGAFTDARRDKPGHFVLAHGGTILLDEIGDITPAFQLKLLRVLQEGEVQPLGGTRPVKVDVRVLAATNRDLASLVAGGKFREDLYYRLNVFPITMPPLRERPGDIPLLVEHFVAKYAQSTGKVMRGADAGAIASLSAYPWPGNVRELENVIERAMILAAGEVLCATDLDFGRRPLTPLSAVPAPAPSTLDTGRSLAKRLSDQERAEIVSAVEQAAGNIAHAARALGINRSTLYYRMRKHDLEHLLPTREEPPAAPPLVES